MVYPNMELNQTNEIYLAMIMIYTTVFGLFANVGRPNLLPTDDVCDAP